MSILKIFTNKKFLFAVGAVGVALTGVTAATGTLLANKHLEEKKEEVRKETAEQMKVPVEQVEEVKLTKTDVVKTVWKDYIPTACALTGTFVAFGRLFGVMSKENIALQSLVTTSQATASRLEQKMIEKLGEKDGKEAVTQVKQEVIDSQDLKAVKESRKQAKYFDEHGDELLYLADPWSLRTFRRTKLQIQQAIENVNLELTTYGRAAVNTFYDALDLEETDVGSMIGWEKDTCNDYKLTCNLNGPYADAKVDSEGRAYAVLAFSDEPQLFTSNEYY